MVTIDNVKIKNFRGIESATLENLPTGLFLTGLNGAGKSSLIQAIRMLIWGRVFDVNGNRLKNLDLVGDHGKEATVEVGLTLNGKQCEQLTMSMTIKAGHAAVTVFDKHNRVKFAGDPREVRRMFWDYIGANSRHAECAGNPKTYVTSKELGDVLSEMLVGDIDRKQLMATAGDHAKWLEQWPGLDSLESLKSIGQAAYTRRTDINRDIKMVETKIAELETTEIPCSTNGTPLNVADLSNVRDRIRVISAERDALLEERGRLSEGGMTADRLDAKRAEVRDRIAKIEDKIAPLQTQVDSLEREQEACGAEIKELGDKLSDLHGQSAQAENILNQAKTQRAKLADGAICPTCKRRLGEKARKELLSPMDDTIAEANTKLGTLLDREHTFNQLIEDRNALRKKAVQEVEAVYEKLGPLAADLREAHPELKQLAALIPCSNRSREDIEVEIDKLDKRIRHGLDVEKALSLLKEFGQHQSHLADLGAEKSHLDWAVNALHDGALFKKFMVDDLGIFEKRCNEQLRAYGYELAVDVGGKTVTVMLGHTGAAKRPVAQASKGEQALTQIAVATAFADNGIVLIDDLDGLDGKFKPIIFQQLETAFAEYGTIILAGAWGLRQEPDIDQLTKAMRPTGVVWINDGNCSFVGKGKTA